ncbi:uncharacterized conserved protein YutE, UPF0331/DUF86 family [Thermodesulfovibrio aggregans]|uniref:Uncharacterized conserved protein YutE, UPF0331/DUF86 family n=1 Tax=Thermodesulfovibrio aggregans TaxID=86166 RepID=A0A0U9HMY9_9BACT|nr:DUF86 domain-containing protein [Thermodesulfovibrio aggregans]GAQ93849.1 uncharacterized conserved protein YutE, UPF0331/DUF86 family [Thermodesulfovibrio aggregans]
MHRKIEYFSKIETIESSLRKLSEIIKKASTYDEYVKLWIINDAAERNLYRAIEALIDIGKILVSDKKLKIPESNREVFLVLAENNLFPTEYLELIYKMIGVRNIIVHSYDKVDDSLVYVILKKNLKDIRKILKLLQEKI